MITTPALKIERFLSVLLMALAAGVVLTRVLQMLSKVQLSGSAYVTIQNGIYQLYGSVVGVIEGFALLAGLVTLSLLPKQDAGFIPDHARGDLRRGHDGDWAAFINPINREIASWIASEFPVVRYLAYRFGAGAMLAAASRLEAMKP